MAKNIKLGGPGAVVNTLTGPALYPTTPASGDPVIMGTSIPGIALFDEDADSEIVALIGPSLVEILVAGIDGGGASAVTHGQKLYYVDGDTPPVSKKASGIPFGIAWETTAGVRTGNLVAAGNTETKIRVLLYPANGIISIAADQIDNTLLANIARGSVKVGGVGNAPTDLDAKTAGKTLVGDGTDIKSVAISGDALLAASGAMTVPKATVAANATVVAHAGDATLDATSMEKNHTNTGAGGNVSLTMPAAAENAGKRIRVQVTAAQTVRIVPAAGEKVFLGGDGVADKYCQIAGVIGNYLSVYSDGTDWLVSDYSGVATKQA